MQITIFHIIVTALLTLFFVKFVPKLLYLWHKESHISLGIVFFCVTLFGISQLA